MASCSVILLGRLTAPLPFIFLLLYSHVVFQCFSYLVNVMFGSYAGLQSVEPQDEDPCSLVAAPSVDMMLQPSPESYLANG